MTEYSYHSVENVDQKSVFISTPFLRQIFVCTGVWAMEFSYGIAFGSPTVVIPQLRKEANSDDFISEKMASWLLSVFGYAGVPWVVIMPYLALYIGRKKPAVLGCCNMLASFLVFYFSKTGTHLLISEIMHGMSSAVNKTVTLMVVTECTAPKYRGIFLTIKMATFFWGMWVANAIGTFFHWKTIPLFGLACSVYMFSSLFWPESPYWLASKGKFKQSIETFRWLRGTDEESERELELMLETQINLMKTKLQRQKSPVLKRISIFIQQTFCPEFYKPLLLSLVVMALYNASGKIVCSMYALVMLKKITGSEDAAYIGMLILDGATVLGMYVGCVLSKYLQRRTLLLGATSVGILFLYLISLYLYLVNIGVVVERALISISLLIGFSTAISCGPIIMSASIYSELLPLRFKSSGLTLTTLFANINLTTFLLLSPLFFNTFLLHGTFLFYALTASLCSIILYFYLPETKDKTLHEIENYFKRNYLTDQQTESNEDAIHLS